MDETMQIVLYEGNNGAASIEVYADGETLWATQKSIAELFEVNVPAVSKHLKNIYEDEELMESATVSKMEIVQNEGGRKVKRKLDFYNLDAIIAVGYRINSKSATQFRIWATKILNEYIRKGFALDDNRLKKLGGGNYFKELLERIRDIRVSEKVFYRQVLEIYATSIDYDPNAKISKEFFMKVQNKIHYAIQGQTANEVIFSRADAEKDFMGLTTFVGNQPTLAEAKIAKNYLNTKELEAMGQLVSGYLDFAERLANKQIVMTMEDWANHLDNLLTATGEQLLMDAGKIGRKQALDKATTEYVKYKNRTLSDVENDFFESLKELEQKLPFNKKE